MKYVLGIILLFSVNVARAEWTEFLSLKEVYFEGLGENQKLVVAFDKSFHTCGWNIAAHLKRSTLGDEVFETYTSVILATWFANGKLSLNYSGCDGERAKGLALRFAR